MLYLLLCGLFPHTHGYHYRQPINTYPSSLSPHGSIYHNFHTFQAYPGNHGTHTFEKSQPETSYRTYSYENSQSYGNGHVQKYPWQTQWKTGWIANSNDGSQGGGQDGESHVVNGQNLPSQEKAGGTFFLFGPTTKPDQGSNYNYQAAEIITKPSSDEINEDDDSKSPPFPGEKNHDDHEPDPLPFTAKNSHNNDLEPPPFPGNISDDGNPASPPFPGKIRDDDDIELPSLPGNVSDDDDTEPPPFPGKIRDDGNPAPPPLPGKIRDDDETEPRSLPGNVSDDDDTEPPQFPGKMSDDDSEPPPFPSNMSYGDASYSGSSGDFEEPTTPGDTSDSMKYFDKISPYTNPVRIGEVSKSADDINEDKTDQSSIENSEFRLPENNNATTPKLRPWTAFTPSDPIPEYYPGIMALPVPALLYAPLFKWHVGIYSKSFTPYMQVCGGSLVKADVVISAAHCFWNDDVGALPPGLFAVAAGTVLRPWETEVAIYTQHSDINDIKIPPRFRGSKTSFQDDIAIVLLTMALEYAPGVRPVCVSFDPELERGHLTSGNLGTIAGWGLTEPNGPPSQRLNYLDLPYVDIEECIRTADDNFLKYITSDKICAGDQKSGRALCRGDSGGGLIYPEDKIRVLTENSYYSATVPYLHGIASTAPRDGNQCNAYAVATFTHVLAHRRFLEAHVPGIEEGCEELYVNATASAQYDITGVSQENANDKIFTNPILENISNSPGVLVPLTVPSKASEDMTDKMWQNEGFQNVTELTNLSSQNEEQLTDTPMLESDANESEGHEESIKTNEETVKTNEKPRKTNEESKRRKEESTMLNKESNEEVVMNVGSGERGVARVLIDNSTKIFVCNCHCNK